MENYVIAIWGDWKEDAVRSELVRALTEKEFFAINLGSVRIGAISVKRHNTHHQLEQLYLAPKYQNMGYGTKIITDVISSAKAEGKPVRV
jgi:GNAT superfamily N-acetyltransferase